MFLKEDEKGVAAMCKAMEDMRNEVLHEQALENAEIMLKDGVSVEKTAMYSGLSKDEVEKLAITLT